MKRTVAMLRRYAGARSLLLTLSLFITGGCSGSGGEGGDGRYGMDRSEFIAIKKANKNLKDFKKALRKQKNEKLKEESAVVETTTSG